MAMLYAGTSGFAYPAWKPGFYPAKLPAKQFLKHYAERLNSVEINYTFRRLPSAGTLKAWVEATPPGFVFAVKANQRITHILRLKNAEEATELFFRMIDPLRTSRRLGPVLFQLPPAMKCDVPLLRSYLDLLPSGMRYAFEFRHASWLQEETYAALLGLAALFTPGFRVRGFLPALIGSVVLTLLTSLMRYIVFR